MTSPSTSRRAGLALGSLVLGYLLIVLVAGAPDSPLVPPLPAEAGRPGWSVAGADWIGLDRLTRTGLTAVSIALLAAVLVAFSIVVLEAWRSRVRPALVLVGVGVSLALSVAAPVVLSRDVYSYAAYGRMYSLHDANPYVHPPSAFPRDPFVAVASPAWIDTRAVYGPAFVISAGGISRLWAASPGETVLAFKVLAGIGAALATVLAAWAARSVLPGEETSTPERLGGRTALAAAAVGLNPVMVIHTVGGAHNDALIAACLAGALVLAVRWITRDVSTRAMVGPVPFGVTALLTLAGLIKVVVFPLLLVWLWFLFRSRARSGRALGVAVHAGAAVALSLAFAAPFLDSTRAMTSLVTLTSVEGWASPARLVARGARALGDAVGGSGAANVLGKAVVIGFLVLFATAFTRFLGRRQTERVAQSADRLANTWGVFTIGLALAIPYLLPWYAAWFLPFLALLTEGGFVAMGFAVAGLLALTGIPAEPGSAPDVWRDMVLGVHYGVAPIMLGLFLGWLARVAGLVPRPPGDFEGLSRMADRARP
jgi:alpha-1,6-mannosyltransferase